MKNRVILMGTPSGEIAWVIGDEVRKIIHPCWIDDLRRRLGYSFEMQTSGAVLYLVTGMKVLMDHRAVQALELWLGAHVA